MRIIADSGSTKTDWLIITHRDRRIVTTAGMNPALNGVESLVPVIASELKPQLPAEPTEAIAYYGAGCASDEICRAVGDLLSLQLGAPRGRVEVGSDMLGAARALCGNHPGIVCILGTGSNSCLYDGRQITDNIPPLGYILGDEGSGANLGIALVNAVFKRRLPADLISVFTARYDLDKDAVIARVYRSEAPNRFLASLTPFLKEHIDVEEVSRLVVDAFCRFFEHNVLAYSGYRSLPLHFTGSIAVHFEEQLREAAARFGLEIASIIPRPITQY